ncbi:MAG: hypothetical protein ACK5G9_09970 [Akkermansiaceae bacterium]|jgi:hypothetical protein
MIRLLIACLAALLVSSCLDSHEEVWINADASGKARVQLSLPTSAVVANGGEKEIRSMIINYFESTPVFTSYALETSTLKDQLKIDLTMTFENAFDLKDSISSPEFQKLPDAADDLLGKFKAEIQERKLTFHRQIDLTKTIPGSVFIPNEQLKDHKLVTIIHLPKAASSHNAHSIENSGKTLIWSTPIATAFRDPLSQSFIMPLPIPWIKIGSTALAVIVLIGAIFYYIHSKNKSKRI